MAEERSYMSKTATSTFILSTTIVLTYVIFVFIWRLYIHPLAKYPGPRIAAVSQFWKAYVECFQQKSFCHELFTLHRVYGNIVRVGPNELHFASPTAYMDIYNNKNRWNKEQSLYHSMGEDQSSFGFLSYRQAKERRDLLARMFSTRAVKESRDIVRSKTKALCEAFEKQTEAGKPFDLFFAFRCVTMDVITYLCFGQPIDAVNAPGFKAPLIEAMDNGLPLVPIFRHFKIARTLITSVPPYISIATSPQTAGLIRMQQLLKKQIANHIRYPETLTNLPHSTTVYHLLLDPAARKTADPISPTSLYEECQALMFGGGETTANALMIGAFHLLKNPAWVARLKEELLGVWPVLDNEPDPDRLEKLPRLNAVIKESLRIGPGIPSGLPRIVPPGGATIDGASVPAGTIVSMSSYFVHHNESIFPDPDRFKPDRWLGWTANQLEEWLVPFSRGPRQCIGLNLAWCEMRMVFAHVFRKFELHLDDASSKMDFLPWRDVFGPYFTGPHLKATMEPVQH